MFFVTPTRSSKALSELKTKVKEAFAKLAPPERLTADAWAESFRFTGANKWDVAEVEVARGPLRAITEPGVRTITVMSCTQVLKTEVLINAVGLFAHLDPCPILVVQPNEKMAQKFSKARLTKFIRDTPVLRKVFEASKSRATSNTLGFKVFEGGDISIVTAGSPGDLAMMSIRVVLLDEIDKYPASAGAEGDPVMLAEERMNKYAHNSLSIRVCSPTDTVESRILKSYLTSDQRKPHVCCDHCGTWQWMGFDRVKCDKDPVSGAFILSSARYTCANALCPTNAEEPGKTKRGWTEAERKRALGRGKIRWLQTASFSCCGEVHHPDEWSRQGGEFTDNETGEVIRHKWDEVGHALCPSCSKPAPNRHAGFGGVSKLYYPRRPLSDLFEKFVTAIGDINLMRTFVNTQLGEAFEETGEAVDAGQFEGRLEDYDAEMPTGGALLTYGADVQGDRIEVEVVAWGADEENWAVEYKVFYGDTLQPYIWLELGEWLRKGWKDAQGRTHFIQAGCMDSNFRTPKVVDFMIQHMGRRWYAIRGDRQEMTRKPVWPIKSGKTKHRNFDVYTIGLAAAKDQIMGRLSIQEPGPGYSHFPRKDDGTYGEDYFEQLTAEIRVTRKSGNHTYYAWKKRRAGLRNEAHDVRVYAYAALESLKAQGLDVNRVAAQFGFTRKTLEGHSPDVALAKRNEKPQGDQPWTPEVDAPKAPTPGRSGRKVLKRKLVRRR